jgi:hypothetical protein
VTGLKPCDPKTSGVETMRPSDTRQVRSTTASEAEVGAAMVAEVVLEAVEAAISKKKVTSSEGDTVKATIATSVVATMTMATIAIEGAEAAGASISTSLTEEAAADTSSTKSTLTEAAAGAMTSTKSSLTEAAVEATCSPTGEAEVAQSSSGTTPLRRRKIKLETC